MYCLSNKLSVYSTKETVLMICLKIFYFLKRTLRKFWKIFRDIVNSLESQHQITHMNDDITIVTNRVDRYKYFNDEIVLLY